MTGILNALIGLGGGGSQLFVEDVFSTYLYTGNSSTQTITNGIDLSGQGGLVWIKPRNGAFSHILQDTLRGAGNFLQTNAVSANVSEANLINSFNANGFTLGSDPIGRVNFSGTTYVSWTFREAPNFFDVVTYTGNGGTQNIAHSLGVAPGMIIVKCTSLNVSWAVYHRSQGATKQAILNTGDAFFSDSTWANTEPTSTQFTVGGTTQSNSFTQTYVAYLFAHDPSADGIIQCGSFTAAANTNVNLGWEPQWIMFKGATYASNWQIIDNMRGMPVGSDDRQLMANLSNAESDNGITTITATGFTWLPSAASETTIYMAIRRGPMRTPTLGTSVFYPQTVAQTGEPDSSGVPFPPDLVNTFSRNGTDRTSVYDNFLFVDRLRSLGVPSDTYSGGTAGRALVSSSTGAELSASDGYVQLKADSQNITRGGSWNNPLYGNWIYYFFRRAPGFMDVVCYTGTSNFPQSYNHNLGVAPEMIIVKCRNSTTDGDASIAANWWVGVKGPQSSGANSGYVFSPGLNTTNAVLANDTWGSGVQTATSFIPWYVTLRSGSEGITGQVVGKTYVAYLFASVPGVSKVGSYTGNGSSQTINCAFTTGARYVLIKRTDSTGDWYVWDSARGIVAGNDPYLALNSTAVEVTSNDSVDTDSTGFVVNQVGASNINVNAATYIFLAIA